MVNLPRGFLNDIQQLIKEGKYASIEEFVEAAIYNQLFLEKDSSSVSKTISVRSEKLAEVHPIENKIVQQPVVRISELFDLAESRDVSIIDPPKMEALSQGIIWGQYNKLFPVKLTTRILANMLKPGSPTISLNEFSEIAAEAARNLGFKILDSDRSKKRKRGTKLSTALPVGDNPYKSKNRFMSHFIGYREQQGTIVGAPAKLRFINIIVENGTKIGITKHGLDFSLLKNPLLDENGITDVSFSDEEIDFLLNHISSHIPEEADGIRSILSAIQEGKNRPDDLTNYIERIFSLSKSNASIVRGGLVSRMVELRLISSSRVGMRHVNYALTKKGLSLLHRWSED